MERKEIDLIIERFLSGTTTDNETESLIQYLKENGDNRLNYFITKRIWLESYNKSPDDDLVDHSWARLKLRMNAPENQASPSNTIKRKIPWRKLAVAASISILAATSVYLGFQKYLPSSIEETAYQINAPLGSRTNIVLPDGSTVWLNSGSSLSYSSSFNIKDREVSLVGEAFFNIKHQNNTYFTVNTSDLRIRVLGTQFNVKSYPDEKMIHTTLVDGKVEVESVREDKSNAPIIMAPNQRLIYVKSDQSITLVPNEEKVKEPESKVEMGKIESKNVHILKNIDPLEDTSWKDGKLVIKSESMESLARKLERYYNVSISFQHDSIKRFKYSGVLDEVTIEEVLRAIQTTSPIRFEIDKNQVILSLCKK